MNDIYQNMLSAYDLSTDQSKRNATSRLISKLFLQVYTKVAFLIRLHFMVELVYASFTD